jgi:hypothetical protein
MGVRPRRSRARAVLLSNDLDVAVQRMTREELLNEVTRLEELEAANAALALDPSLLPPVGSVAVIGDETGRLLQGEVGGYLRAFGAVAVRFRDRAELVGRCHPNLTLLAKNRLPTFIGRPNEAFRFHPGEGELHHVEVLELPDGCPPLSQWPRR